MKQIYTKMRLSNKLLKNIPTETPYQKLAREFEVSPKFVGMIARGERIPLRGKGLKIKKRIEQLISDTEQ